MSRPVWLPIAALITAGCGSRFPAPVPVQRHLSLTAFDGCGALETYIKDTASLEMRTTLEQAKEGYRGPRGIPLDTAPGTEPATASKESGPGAYTRTNTQVAGVDEADFVKNDGTRLFVLSGRTLYLNQSWPAEQLRTVSRLGIEGWPREMYLEGNHVVVFSHVYTKVPYGPGAENVKADLCVLGPCGEAHSTTLKITVVDVSNLAEPRVISELYQPGNYVSSRRVHTSVRLVLSDSLRWPSGVRWYPEFTPTLYNDRGARARAFDQLMEDNEKLIRASRLEDWLPRNQYRAADGSLHEVGYDCSEFHRSNAPSRLGLLSVATLDMAPATLQAHGRPQVTRTSLIAQAGEVYSSATGLYVASRHWWWWPTPGQEDHTYLYKFDLTHPSGATYVAAGGVEGHILDQFSMDEHAGYLRVATTLSRRVESVDNPWGRLELTNRLSVLTSRDGALEVVGRSEDLAPGERIFSSRFIGNRGFVVTFRQVDPLFTFDLSDPEHPRKVGELKVPGFSTYLHPIDDDHLIALGEHLPEDSAQWQARAFKLSMFDVSDFAHPKETFTQLVGTAHGWSEAQWDHKAFNYFPEKRLLAIPFSDWNSRSSDYWSSFISDLRVFTVDPASGFVPRGALTMKDVYQEVNHRSWSWYWTPAIRRSVMADDYVYAIADSGIRVADVDALDQPIATVTFPRHIEE